MSDVTDPIAPVERVYMCPKCPRTMRLRVDDRKKNGHTMVVFECPKHGAFPGGWRSAYLAKVREHVINERKG